MPPGTVPESRAVPRRVWSAAALQGAGRVFAAACTFATLALLARALEPEAFGRYTFYLAVFALLDALTDFGTGAASVQLSSATGGGGLGDVVRAGRAIRRRMAGLGALAVAGALLLTNEPDWPFVLVATAYQWTHGLELTATVYKNAVRWRVPVLARCFAAAARLAFVAILLALGVRNPGVHLLATAVGSSLANVLLHVAARRHVAAATGAGFDSQARALWRIAWPLGLAAICQQGYFYLDNLFVRVLSGDAELGRYNAGVRMMSFLLLGAQYASLAALPWLTRRRALGDGAAAARLGQPLFAVAGLVLGALVPHAGALLAVGFGEPYRAAGPSLVWLLAAAAVVHVGAVLVTAGIAFGATRAVLAVAASALLVNGALNAWWVPLHGITGAGAATFVTEVWVTVGAAWALQRHGAKLGGEHPWRWLGGPIGFAVGMALGGWVEAAWPGLGA